MIEKTYYLRDSVPMMEEKHSRGEVVYLLSNPFNPQTDTEITVDEYNTAVQDAQNAMAALMQSARDAAEQFKVDRAVHIGTATAKLLVLGLTQDEIDAIFGA